MAWTILAAVSRRDLALSPVRPRRLLAVARRRRRRAGIACGTRAPKVVAVVPARNEAAVDRREPRLAAAAELSAVIFRRSGRRPEHGWNGRSRPRGRRGGSAPPSGSQSSRGAAVPSGWTGKLWALSQGIEAAQAGARPPDYLLLTDADIAYTPDALAGLVARAKAGGFVLTSLMAKLRCLSRAERAFVPAFIFFFQMLYPFAWVNRPSGKTAAAAGGSMLVGAPRARSRRRHRVHSRRPDRRLRARQAPQAARSDLARPDRESAELARLRRDRRYSPHGDALGLCAIELFAWDAGGDLSRHGLDLSRSADLAAYFGTSPADTLGLAAWALMAIAFQPTLRFYRRLARLGSRFAAHRRRLSHLHARFRPAIPSWSRRNVERARASLPFGGTMTASRFRLRQDPSRREFPGRFAVHRGTPSRADPGLLSLRARRRRCRRQSGARARAQIGAHRCAWRRRSWAAARPKPRPCRCARRWRQEGSVRAMPSTSSRRSAATSPRTARGISPISSIIAPIRRCRSGASCSTCMARTQALWPLSDAICAALQINNHLQDCAADYRQLDRVYVPLEDLAAHGIGPEALAAPRASPALRACLRGTCWAHARLC